MIKPDLNKIPEFIDEKSVKHNFTKFQIVIWLSIGVLAVYGLVKLVL